MAGSARRIESEPAPTSLHQRILADIERHILSGEWPPGHRIPSEHELSASYGCSRMTVNKVLTQLARGGLLERRRKAGSFVMRPQSRSAVLEIQDIRTEVTALGQAYRHELIARRKRRSTRADASALGLDAAAAVLQLDTLHFAGPRKEFGKNLLARTSSRNHAVSCNPDGPPHPPARKLETEKNTLQSGLDME